MRRACLTTLVIALALAAQGAAAQSGGPVKIGVLSDMASIYADITGEGTGAAARLAVEDMGPVRASPSRSWCRPASTARRTTI